METLAPEAKDANSEIYFLLGIAKSGKGVVGFPRVLSLLSSILERSVEKNELLIEAAEIKEVVTVFHGLRAPNLSIRKYIDRIFKYAGCSPSCFVVAQIYVDRFLDRAKINLNSLNVHRLLITSIMVAAKFNDDAFFNNAYYAKVGGVTTVELNRLEMEFLFTIDFRLKVSIDTFRTYCHRLEREASEGLQIGRPIQACRMKESWSGKDDSMSTCASTVTR